ncbi:MAG: prohibitin family protein [Deltaproteobacteria bacterium]|nr:prohibitin family protein [Deltaproteobacteria bacterium]MBI4196240.1 prohibitin family protein [Deltaproteobacteria bacterium]
MSDESFNPRDLLDRLFPRKKGLLFYVGLLFLVWLSSKCFTIIPAGNVGIKDFFGKIYSETIPAGFHIVNPLLRIHKMSIRTQQIEEAANVPSKEGLSVTLDASLLFSLNPEKAAEVYRTIGPDYTRVVVVPQARSVVRGVTASYEAKALYTSERSLMSDEIYKQLAPLMEERGITIEKVLLRNVTLPQILSTAIEKKLEAEQQSEQMKFVLDKEKQEADRKRVEAQGIADFQRIVTSGLTPFFLTWKGIEATAKLADSQNTKVVVIGSGKDGLPIILGGNN